MNSDGTAIGKLSTLDLISCVADTPQRPLDFTLLFHLNDTPSFEALRTGARSARNCYPATGSYINGRQWTRFVEPSDGVTHRSLSFNAEITKTVEEFLDRPFDPRKGLPVEQILITNGRGDDVKLATRFHHAVADGLSAAMWLGHQLRVADGQEEPLTEPAQFNELPLRSHPSPLKTSRFASRGQSQLLWTSLNHPSRTRRWRTININAEGMRERCRRNRGFTYNDLLATCLLEVFGRWNDLHAVIPVRKIGLWLPINIRRQLSVGFGNGTSRIRLYARFESTDSLVDKCRKIRRQVSCSFREGEWAVPVEPPLGFLPLRLSAPLLRRYLNRPQSDFGTAVFSHVERWNECEDNEFQKVEKIECIGPLHKRHCVAVNGVTHRGQTWLSFTYDPGLLTAHDIEQLTEMFQEQIDMARKVLA